MKKVTSIQGIHVDVMPYLPIHWYLTQRCNYKCSYCIDGTNLGSKDSEYNNTINWLTNSTFYKPICVNLFGGEPTLHPNFIEICDLLNSINIKFSVHSNLSRDLDFYLKLLKYDNFILTTCSLHISQLKDINEFIQKINKLSQIKDVNVLIFLEKENIDKILKYIDIIKNNVIKGRVRINNSYNYSFYKGYDLSCFDNYMQPYQKHVFTYEDNTNEIISELEFGKRKVFDCKLCNFICETFMLNIDVYGNVKENCMSTPTIVNVNDKDSFIYFKYKQFICKQHKCLPCYFRWGKKYSVKHKILLKEKNNEN